MANDKCFICANSERDPECGYTCSKELWKYFGENGAGCPCFKEEKREEKDN